MTLKIYRIDTSFFGKMNNRAKKPDLPVQASLFGSMFKNYKDYKRENSYVLSKKDEIDRFTEAFGNNWVEDQYYIRHPKETRTNYLIPANKFHSYIMREQIGDLISYIRANLRVKELDLTIKSNKSGSIGLKGIIESVPMEGSTQLSTTDEYTVKIKCLAPLKASERKTEYLWIKEFPHIIELVDNASNGLFSLSESFDLSFGLDISAAEAIGANINYHGQNQFNFTVIAD
ncbi:hypothetical protein [Vibrio sp. PNB22_1_1]|uniref:hypothetical protein n=1 Tax=unclassified Vibrio TaxID=2614977 RepID=UPI00406AACB1